MNQYSYDIIEKEIDDYYEKYFAVLERDKQYMLDAYDKNIQKLNKRMDENFKKINYSIISSCLHGDQNDNQST
jgi:hypothetical protein